MLDDGQRGGIELGPTNTDMARKRNLKMNCSASNVSSHDAPDDEIDCDDDDENDCGSNHQQLHQQQECHARHVVVARKMKFLTGMAALGGFLFGYDTGVVSGAMLPLRREFSLSAEEQEVVVSSTVLAAFVSSLSLAPYLNVHRGRRHAVLVAASVFGAGSILLGLSTSYTSLVVGRLLVGVGIGIASVTTPVYLAEVAVPKMRGRLVTINTLLITLGQFIAGMVDGFFDEVAPESGWRWMLGLAAVPSIVMFWGFWFYLPESPRYLVNKGRVEEAEKVLDDLRETPEEARIELREIIEALPVNYASADTTPGSETKSKLDQHTARHSEMTTLSSASNSSEGSESSDGNNSSNSMTYDAVPDSHLTFDDDEDLRNPKGTETPAQTTAASSYHQFISMLQDPPTRRALIVGCGLMAIQQCSGINTVMYYAASIYEMSGFEEQTAVWLSGFTALAQVVGIAASIFLVDRAGRRTLVLWSLGFVTISLAGLAGSFYLLRVTSGDVVYAYPESNGKNLSLPWTGISCDIQPAAIWDGVTAYCYDCVSISGCGFRNGYCYPGNETGPFASFSEDYFGDWEFDTCGGGGDSGVPNPFGVLCCMFMISYLLSFGIGMGGMPWTINAEIYSLQYRSMAVSLSTGTNWIGNLVVSATFLSLSSPASLTAYGAFGLYGMVALFGWAWLYCCLPETKGLSLEEIQDLFCQPRNHPSGRSNATSGYSHVHQHEGADGLT